MLVHKSIITKIAPGGAKSDDFDKNIEALSIMIVPHFAFFVNKKPPHLTRQPYVTCPVVAVAEARRMVDI